MKVAVVGTGYVGLVTGVCFATIGNDVTCVDIDAAKVAALRKGQLPIYEPGLKELFDPAVATDRLHVTTELAEAVQQAEVIFLALPTPPGEDGSADLSYILQVADELGPLINHYTVVIDKSTVPVGTSELVRQRIALQAKAPFDVVSNPEFLREGFAVDDFMAPDRIVVGTGSKRAGRVLEALYAPITAKGHPLLLMSERSAELTKYAANSFLAMKITFMNQIANLCELSGANVDDVRLGVGSDQRIGERFLFPGIGYGGSCFPKDVQALVHTAQQHGYDFTLLQEVIALNLRQQHRLQEKVLAYFGGDVRGKTFALWGLAFKQNTDDVRQAPALELIADLTTQGARVQAYDPEAMPNTRRVLGDLPGLSFADGPLAAAQGADALLIATEWPQFAAVPLTKLKQALVAPLVFDGRNLFQPVAMGRAGFHYESIGRAPVHLGVPQSKPPKAKRPVTDSAPDSRKA